MRFTLAFFLAALPLFADEATDSPAVILSGPEITKLDWGTRALAHADVDQDGREDIGVINNDRARIEILYQRDPDSEPVKNRTIRRDRWDPVLEDTRFNAEGVVSGIAMYDLELGDVTGDGLPDIVFSSKDEPLVVVPQLEPGSWGDKREYDALEALPWNSTMQLFELSDEHDGLELVMLTKDRLMVFAFNERGQPIKLHELHRMAGSGKDLDIMEATADSPIRFTYRVPSSSRALRIVEWEPVNGPGAEAAYSLDTATPGVAWVDPDAVQPQIMLIEPRTGKLRVEQLTPTKADDRGSEWPIEYYSTGADVSSPEAYAFGDFDGDGIGDIVAADSANAQIWMLSGSSSGGWKPAKSYPSFQGVEALAAADIDGDQQAELFVLSEKENTVGLTRWNGERFVFPDAVTLNGEPKRILWLDDSKQLIVLTEDSGKYYINLLESDDAKQWAVAKSIQLDGIRREPTGLLLSDLDQDDTTDLLIAVPRDSARYLDLTALNQLPEDEWDDVIAEVEGLRELDLSKVGLGDVNGDGHDELLVAAEGFVRAIYLNDEMRRTVLDQFNSRSGNDRLSIPSMRDIDHDGVADMLLFDSRERGFQVLRRDDAGIYRYDQVIELGDLAPVAVLNEQSSGDSEIVLLGKSAITRSPYGSDSEALHTMATYESDLNEIVYNEIKIAELNGADGTEILLVDGQNNVLEILKWDGGDSWQSALHFNVFEEDLHYGGRKGAPLEPREILIGDFTNDGKNDIVLLVHDRMLLYPQGIEESTDDPVVN
ncbi:MAG: VCBS repeat-containing protein [Verrucomicrobiota bacterium]